MNKVKCYICGTDMEEKITSTTAGWGTYKLIIDGTKAYVCPECGEVVYDPNEVNMIQNISKGLSNAEERPDILNVTEVVDLLRESSQTIYNMLKDGKLKAKKAGREWRFSRKDMQALIDSNDYTGNPSHLLA